MIRVTCPRCASKLNAKDALAGQTRKCPKCGAMVLIPEPDQSGTTAGEGAIALAEAAPDQHVHGAIEKKLPAKELPERLGRQNRYLICDKSKLVAAWENNGHGWMLKTNFGFISATRNYDQLPAQGNFKLVELQLKMTDEGLRLAGIRTYQLARRWALTNLDKGDDKILSAVTDSGFLNKEQKSVVQKAIKEQFMRHVWEGAANVLDYLTNGDYHSPGVEEPIAG